MKKTLAIVLSFALVLSLCAGLFVFPASAETPATDFATEKANELWASTQHKAETVRVSLYTTAEGRETVRFLLNDGDTVTLTEKGGYTGGTLSLKDGVLTADKVTYDTTTDHCLLEPVGAIKLFVTGGDFTARVRNHAILAEEEYKNTESTDNHILITSDGHKFIGAATDGNKLRGRGAIVIYGDIGVDLITSSAYHSVVSEATGAGNDIIISPKYDSKITADGHGPAIENRDGSIIFGGAATISLSNANAGAATNGKQLLHVTNAAVRNSSIEFIEDVNVNFETKSVGVAYVNTVHDAGSNAIVFNTSGEVTLKTTDAAVTGWASAFMANFGSIAVLRGTVLANINIATYTFPPDETSSYHAFGMNNDGGAGANTDMTAKFSVSGDAEIAVYMRSAAMTKTRMGAIWVNSVTIEFVDNAKFTAAVNYAGAAHHGSTCTVTAKVGAFIVDDNAKVALYNLDVAENKGTPSAVQIQPGNKTAAQIEAFKGLNGIWLKGGQIEINNYAYALANTASNETFKDFEHPNIYEHGITLSNGVIALNGKEGSNVTFGKNPNAPEAPYYHTTKDYVFCGKVGAESNPNNRNVQQWVYMGEDDAYTYYNGIADHADFFGASDYMVGSLSAAANTFVAPAAGNYKVSATGAITCGEKTVPNNAVITLKTGDVLTAEGITVAMTKAEASVAAAPANLKVVDGSVTSSGAKVTWDASDYAVSYNVYANGQLVGNTAATELQMALVSNTEYTITVKAVNYNGAEGAASEGATLKTEKGESDYQIPAAPANVKVSGVNKVSATVTWDAVVDAASYDVYLNGTKLTDTPVTVTTYALTALTAGTQYKVQITASNIAGTSEKSAEVAFTTIKEGAVEAVEITLADSTVTLNSDNPSALDGAVTFDATKSELTLNNASGIKKISWNNGALTMKIVGTNTVDGGDDISNVIWGNGTDADLTVTGTGTLNVSGKAYILGSQTGDLIIDGPIVNVTSKGGTAVHVSAGGQNSQILIKGATKLTVNSAGYGIDAAGIAPSIIIKDTATVKVDANSIGIAVRPSLAATDAIAAKGTLHILDKANVEIESVGSGIIMPSGLVSGKSADTEAIFTTSGKVKVISTLSDWSAAGIFFYGNNDCSNKFTVKNGTLDVTVNQNDGSEVCAGIYFQNKVDVLFEDATVNSTVNANSTVKTNRAQAIYLAKGTTALVTGDAVVNTLVNGTAAYHGWNPAAASFHVHESTLTVDGDAVINAKSNAPTGKVTALALQQGKVIVKGNAKVYCDAKGQSAVFNWDGKTNSIEVLESGYLNMKSDVSAIRTIATFSVNEESVKTGKYADKEMTIVGPEYNAGTSDFVPAFAAIAILATVACAAVIVLRKKFN